jgi:hypothetical protein
MVKPAKSLQVFAVAIVAGLCLTGCSALRAPRQQIRPIDASPSMPALVASVAAKIDPASFVYLNSQQAAMFKKQLEAAPANDVKQRVDLERSYAEQLMNSGKVEESVQQYEQVRQQIQSVSPQAWKQMKRTILGRELIAYLRMGEQQNCCATNNSYSCLIPISGPGVHTRQEGSRNAIRILTDLLHDDPGDLRERWLLNIADMTVGDYPHGVPANQLIPAAKLGTDYPLKPFVNVAPQLGLDPEGWAGGVVMEDFEDNGLLDILISSLRWDKPGQLRYMHNNGDGTFSDRTREAGLADEPGGLNMIVTDYNNDGRPDVVILRGGWFGKDGHFPLSLVRNDGHGHFTDVTVQAGLLTYGPTQTAVAFDYNGDGLLDLFVGYESSDGDVVSSRLFRNNGDGTFTDVTEQCGLHITRFVKAAVTADYLHTGRPGLYLSCKDGSNILLRNDGPAGADHSPRAPWRFTDVSATAGVSGQQGTFACTWFDYDNDGWPDLFVCGYGGGTSVGDIAADYVGAPTPAYRSKLFRNNHDGTFTDVSRETHLDRVILGMSINYGDLDNDGWLDFYVGTGNPDLSTLVPKRMFRNHNGRYFDEVTVSGNFGHLQKGHGIAFGDLENNGQQDVFIVLGGAYEGDTAHDCLFLNPGNPNHWITLNLEGARSNRIGLGAEIAVTVDAPQGERTIYKTVSTGGSFGCSPLRQEIGLGDAKGIKQVTIRWPATGATQVLQGLAMDHFYKVREDAPAAEPWSVPVVSLAKAAAQARREGPSGRGLQ